ncbi:MAG: hypothetical protein K0Q50_152 [Vampirovibrio sp.]|jgi:hypothetical protein|nr:hypothetical protein [Vampirovibrio sp.]
MAHTDLIFEMLVEDLSAPRVLLEQVVNYINDHYSYSTADLYRFFDEKYPQLEDYEVDLTFSPQYTPAEHHRLEYIPLLGAKHLSKLELTELKRRLEDAKLEIILKSPDGRTEMKVPVHETSIERYVNLLRLDLPLPDALYREILANVPEESHNEVNLLSREDIWQNQARQDILVAFLRAFKHLHNFSTVKISFLTNFVRTYRPAHLLELERQLDSLIESCQVDMENVQGRGFHDEYLKALNVGNDLTQVSERNVWSHYQHMMDISAQLKADFQAIAQVSPESLEKAKSQTVV